MSIEQVLAREESALAKDKEIGRILQCTKNDYVAVLELDPLDLEELATKVKKLYRKKSLMIHPDKVSNPEAPEAFDRLKKAEQVLSNQDKEGSVWAEKTRLLDIYKDVCSKQKDIKSIQTRVAEILGEEIRQEEIDRLYNQRQEAQRRDEEKAQQTKREKDMKMKHAWEDDRDTRVQSWRNYTAKVEKKKKKKTKKVLA
ncbi:uncharacterized protein CANTADRAFT_21144 [Suhomyces tanzawaensis NRRL Y-17324]|uniref:J domain-containing protein n=1 Tax=Suhomyces tanzawaensis NRRL Y-17324 TaxID=984487 RepID=A0A1E4SK32_9ASCO|nr:uncharacterized protein CANTADRAFT_21144 [Suhomyces tanzawaensis NRRL Y-17324]ODV79863.1 hypothetical protein CANTADRAFT_21144 [Suhomyces tanzawaensis NRRL Y-17324]